MGIKVGDIMSDEEKTELLVKEVYRVVTQAKAGSSKEKMGFSNKLHVAVFLVWVGSLIWAAVAYFLDGVFLSELLMITSAVYAPSDVANRIKSGMENRIKLGKDDKYND